MYFVILSIISAFCFLTVKDWFYSAYPCVIYSFSLYMYVSCFISLRGNWLNERSENQLLFFSLFLNVVWYMRSISKSKKGSSLSFVNILDSVVDCSCTDNADLSSDTNEEIWVLCSVGGLCMVRNGAPYVVCSCVLVAYLCFIFLFILPDLAWGCDSREVLITMTLCSATGYFSNKSSNNNNNNVDL